MENKSCSRKNCKQNNPQPIDNFWVNRNNTTGRNGVCKSCCRESQNKRKNTDEQRAKRREYFKNNPEQKLKTWARTLKSKYGITIDDYNQMLAAQNSKCEICGIHQNELKKKLVVDHCHESGKVRALLCGHCNSALGFSKEKIHVMENLINYIHEHKI